MVPINASICCGWRMQLSPQVDSTINRQLGKRVDPLVTGYDTQLPDSLINHGSGPCQVHPGNAAPGRSGTHYVVKSGKAQRVFGQQLRVGG